MMVEPEKTDCTAALRLYIAEAKAMIEGLGIYPRRAHRYPFDLIALEHIAKVVSVSEACLLLLDAGKVGEAYGLSRSVVEAALNLRHITSNREDMQRESMRFGRYAQHVKNFWLYYVRQIHPGTIDSAEVATEVKQWELTSDPEPVRKRWIDTWKTALFVHPLDPPVPSDSVPSAELMKKANYALDYFQPSQYVHCSQVAMDWFVPDEGAPFAFRGPQPTVELAPESITRILLVYLHWVIAYALWGLHIDVPPRAEYCVRNSLQRYNRLACSAGHDTCNITEALGA
jgi:hypothetical protein